MTASAHVVEHVACLGCGCACDDIALQVIGQRIVDARGACALGEAWFGDGRVPAGVLVGGRAAALDDAVDAIARFIANAAHPLVYLAPEMSCEAQGEGVGIADALRATLDSVTSATVLPSILASQERGRASATLGEIRNRADVIVCWGVDPKDRYPRFWSRYAPDLPGLHVPEGRRSRTVIAVDVGDARGPADADRRFAVPPHQEVDALTWLRHAVLSGDDDPAPSRAVPPVSAGMADLAAMLATARYTALVADAEPDPAGPVRDRYLAEALNALAQALNGPTRCALTVLRAGGNRSGADGVMTWQTGYPTAVDFARGFPRYRPFDGTASVRLTRGEIDAVLVLGSTAGVPADLVSMMARAGAAVIGPNASRGALAGGAAAIDTGVAGIHESGMALRMDDVPLPLTAPLDGPPAIVTIARALRERIVTVRRRAGKPPQREGTMARGHFPAS